MSARWPIDAGDDWRPPHEEMADADDSQPLAVDDVLAAFSEHLEHGTPRPALDHLDPHDRRLAEDLMRLMETGRRIDPSASAPSLEALLADTLTPEALRPETTDPIDDVAAERWVVTQRRVRYAEQRAEAAEAQVAAVRRLHVRRATEAGPDYCAGCTDQVGMWVRWPCTTVHALDVGVGPTDETAAERRIRDAEKRAEAAEARACVLFDAVAKGTQHVYRGSCPAPASPDARDPMCLACSALGDPS